MWLELLELRLHLDLDPSPRELRGRVVAEAGRDLGQDLGCCVDQDPAGRLVAKRRIVAQGVAYEVGQLAERFDPRVARADEDEGQLAAPMGLVGGRGGGLQSPEDVVPEVDRIREILEAEPVVGEPGDRQHAGNGSDCDHELRVADREHAVLGLDPDEPSFRVELVGVSEEQLRVRAHQPQWDHGVPRLERARGGLREERREEHEVLGADDGRAALPQEPCDVRAGEPAADDQRPSLRLARLAITAVLPSLLMTGTQVSVIGSGEENAARAEEVGRLLAGRGCTVVTGGLGEVMAASARGAKSAGGTTIGILPGERLADANEWVDYAVATGIGHARNLAVVASGQAVIAVGGSWGTLAEIAFARTLGRPVVVLEPGWQLAGEGIERAESAEQAVDLALAHL